nr:MAG TPA: hypothetical protein [Caudoviricetes sp.]
MLGRYFLTVRSLFVISLYHIFQNLQNQHPL